MKKHVSYRELGFNNDELTYGSSMKVRKARPRATKEIERPTIVIQLRTRSSECYIHKKTQLFLVRGTRVLKEFFFVTTYR